MIAKKITMKPSYRALKYNTFCQCLKLRVMQLRPNFKKWSSDKNNGKWNCYIIFFVHFVCVACFLTRCCSDGVHMQVLQMTMVVKLLHDFLHSIIYRVLLVVANGNAVCL